MRLVLYGILGQSPFAGVAWQVLQYLEGFRRAGCDVFYIEDTGAWPYDPMRNTVTDNPAYTTRYIARLMDRIGLADRWAYRAGTDDRRLYGLTERQLATVLDSADVLVNLTAATVLREEHLRVPVRVYLETDPVAPQIEVAEGRVFTIELLAGHTHHFSYAENLGREDCGVPLGRFPYHATRPPVVLDWWPSRDSPGGRFTTVANWEQSGKDVTWLGETYRWSKHHEFLKVLDLPGRVSASLELALAGVDPASAQLLAEHGWRVLDAVPLTLDVEPYRGYILESRGEFTVAKDQNVRFRSGWFSDRSATYLAAGKPVVTQDTGFGVSLPTGRGLFAFRTLDEAAAALGEIEADYELHSRAAGELAAEFFDADRVLADLLARAT